MGVHLANVQSLSFFSVGVSHGAGELLKNNNRDINTSFYVKMHCNTHYRDCITALQKKRTHYCNDITFVMLTMAYNNMFNNKSNLHSAHES